MTGDELSDIRRRLGLTQTDMTALLNERIPWLRLTRGNLARWECGAVTPSPAMQDALSRALSSVPMDPSRKVHAMKTQRQTLDEIQDSLGINPDEPDALDNFELLLETWPWPGEELTPEQIDDYRRALKNAQTNPA